MDLEERLRERMVELQSKITMRNKVDDLKEAINRENSLTVESVAAFAKEKEIEHMRRIIDSNRKIVKYTEHYSNLLGNVETAIETLAQRKPEAKSELAAYSVEVVRLRKRIQEEREREIRMHGEMVELQEKFTSNKELITPLQERTKKNNDQVQAFLAERHRLLEEIKIKEKQLELIFVLKGLSFEEVEMSKSSNKNIQDEVVNFLKNWDKIQRNA
jgi:chromosome segregation ATPase